MSSQPTRWILFILLITGVGLFSEALYQKSIPLIDHIDLRSKTPTHFVTRDLSTLSNTGKLPKYFFQLKNIKWSYYDEELKQQIPVESLPFKTTSNGLYNLEVDAFSSSQKTPKVTIIQMSLIEIKSGNKVWELSRNYEIKK